MAHLWHGISAGANPPLDINVIIEIPSGSKCKYELDKIAGIIKVDRIIASDIPPNILNEILEFFRVYKNLEEKQVVIQGVEPLEVAIEIIKIFLGDYKEKYLT